MKKIAFVVAIALGSMTLNGKPPTTAPATQPSAPPLSNASLRDAIEALARGDTKSAVSIADQCVVDGRRQKLKPDNALFINAAHIQGVALFRDGQTKLAADALQKIVRVSAGDRVMLYNVSVSDLQGHQFIGRAVAALQGYATTHPDDEQIVNLFGMAVDAAAKDSSSQKTQAAVAAYAKIDKQLERTRPNMHRWGPTWIDDARFAEIEATRNALRSDIDYRTSNVRAAERTLARVQDEIKHAQNDASIVTSSSERRYEERYRKERLDALARELRAAASRLDEAKQKLREVTDRLPRPSWDMRLEMVDPEMVR